MTKDLRDKGADAAAAAAVDPDADLMGLITDFNTTHAAWKIANAEWLAEKERVDALPDRPEFSAGKRYLAFLKEHGVDTLSDRSHERFMCLKRAVTAVFKTEAHTHRGVVEKLKIVRLALGDEEGGGDSDLEVLQAGSDELWFAAVMRDFERLAGQAGDDPLVVLWAKWREAEEQQIPEELTEEEAERFTERVAKQGDALAAEIMTAPAQTVLGVYAQIAVLEDWVENGMPNYGVPLLESFHGRVKEALQNAARLAGKAEGEAASDDAKGDIS